MTVSDAGSEGGLPRRVLDQLRRDLDPEELRRRSPNVVTMDVLYLFSVAFLATLAVRGFWPAVLSILPGAAFLYFAWKSSTAFLLANLLVIAVTVWATVAGLLPL